jgi:uncharacterized protein
MMKNTVLWQISPPGAKAPVSYLFGTIHLADQQAFTWYDTAVQHLEQCSCFAAEFDFDDISQASLGAATQLPENQTLETLLRPGVWKKLKQFASTRLGLEPDHILHMHPFLLSNALTATMSASDAAQPLDQALWLHARSKGIATTGVENFEEQVEILKAISLTEHLKQLTWLVKNFKRQGKRLRKMLNRYAAADIRKLYDSARRDVRGMRRLLLYDRNRIMADRIAAMAGEQATFVAVGAGHLAGEKGVLRRLKKAGFKVKPVKSDA